MVLEAIYLRQLLVDREKPRKLTFTLTIEALILTQQLDYSLRTLKCNRRLAMPGKTLLFGLIFICVTVLVLTAVVRRSLCELEIKAGDVQVVAQLAYEAD